MALESGTYVKDLVSTNPPGTDAISQGDDHIRLIKSVLKNSFPSTNSAPIIPDISGNGGYVLQVNTGATATQWADFDSLTRRKGELHRATFEYVSGTSIKVYPGIYDLDAKGKNVSWDSALTVTGLSGTDQWVYIYLDYSGITGTTVTASEIIGSTTAPTWSDSKHGWYNGDDRCIFAVYFSGSAISKWYHSGADHVMYADASSGTSVSTLNTWNDVTIGGPAFADEVELTFKIAQDGGDTSSTSWYYRVDGDSGNGHLIGTTEGGPESQDDEHVAGNKRVFIEPTARNIELRGSTASSTTSNCIVYTNGWYFPGGM